MDVFCGVLWQHSATRVQAGLQSEPDAVCHCVANADVDSNIESLRNTHSELHAVTNRVRYSVADTDVQWHWNAESDAVSDAVSYRDGNVVSDTELKYHPNSISN